MSDHWKAVLRNLGVAIHIPGIMALVSAPVCLIAGEAILLIPFGVCALVSLALGQALYRGFRPEGTMQVRHAMDMAVLAWIAVSLIGMLPFLVSAWLPLPQALESVTLAAFRDPWNALFESVSGFTTTGLTVSISPEALPHSLQWWRSFSQWVGGIGVIVLMLTVFHPSGDERRLYVAEAREETIVPGIIETARAFWWIYLLFTGAAVLALRIAGMEWWHALNYGLSAIATGGFGATDGNIGDFGLVPRIVAMVIIVLGAISFRCHHRLIVMGDVTAFWTAEVRLLAVLLVAGSALIVAERYWSTGEWHVLEGVQHWVSALTTAGFQSSSFESWSPTAHLALVAAMVVGGISGSAAGGLKLNRIVVLGHGIVERVVTIARQPWRVTMKAPLVPEEEAERRRRVLEFAGILALLWFITLLVGSVVLLHVLDRAVPLEIALIEAASALSNVGLSAGITGPELGSAAKATLIVLMWAGRLEIIPLLVLLASLRPGIRRRSA